MRARTPSGRTRTPTPSTAGTSPACSPVVRCWLPRAYVKPMQLEHSFSVPVPVEDAWQALLDPARVTPCFPGATLTAVEGDEFSGTVKVRLGPVSLLYKGTGRFSSVDERAHRVVLQATGKDSRGNGTASAVVTATLADADGATTVGVLTDLTITGRP